MKRTLISLAVVTALTGCATGSAIREKITGNQFDEPQIEQAQLLKKDQYKVQPPSGGPIAVAVYSFQDKTGQRKSQQNIASLSSAVTQGAEGYLIKALQDAGDQRWFTVLERVGLDNLIKERQMIRQMREQYQGRDAKPLPPMLFAGVIVEGAIVGYDSNTQTGGSGVRFLGIGATTQYQSDTVTVVLRTVSVSTGEVLTSVTVTKTVLSYMDKFGVLKFVEQGTQAVEAETGASINESINKATNLAIQAAVVGTIREGARKGHWSYKEEKKDELVQPQTPPEAKETTGANTATETVASVDPKLLAKENTDKNTNTNTAVRADAVQIASAPAVASMPTPPNTASPQVYKTKQRTAVRKQPDQQSDLAEVILEGRELTLVEKKGGWLLVSLNGKTLGWVWKDLVIEVK